MGKNKSSLPFDTRGGVISRCRLFLESNNHQSLSPQAKVLLSLMQLHWRNDKPVDYGVREAQGKIPCGRKMAMKAFDELQKRGFIIKVDESLFNSRTGSKSRTWRLTWLPFKDKKPTNEWEKWTDEN
ncbi:MAG: hypothetical protein ACPG62_10295 [Cycloclasticus sp.]